MNGYQTDAIEELMRAMRHIPCARKLRFECRGIVGGDFDVVITCANNSRLTPNERYNVEVENKR